MSEIRFNSLEEMIASLESLNERMDVALAGMTEMESKADAEMREAVGAAAVNERDRKVREEMEKLAAGEMSGVDFLHSEAGERLHARDGEHIREVFQAAAEMSDEEFRAGVIAEGLADEFPWAADDGRLSEDEAAEYDDRLRQRDRFNRPDGPR